ncbi:hypothetical protein [Bradyrhizobium sp.]|uniref:hypothetical protein n=1 Tax=Bradyrhizobium sp. TaxID=376 RepID=UPI002CABDBC8|nr:hypothetical protein [Bradyrhizobium sp.]HWX58422.1 hypothetical protein [Bradyrhizobium sp.]
MPAVEHDVAAPAGGAIVGNGLTPGEAISVAPNGIPVPPIPVLRAMPSGEVTPIVGVGAAVPVTCATAAPLAKNTTQAVMSEAFTCISNQKGPWSGPDQLRALRAEVRPARMLAAAQWQGLAGMQARPVVTIQTIVVEVTRRISPEAVHGVLMQASIVATDVITEAEVLPTQMLHAARHRSAAAMHAFADASDVSGPNHAADASAAVEATDMASSHHPPDVRATAKTADMAATAKTAAACFGRCDQRRSQRGRRQDHHHSFHRENPFRIGALGRRHRTRPAAKRRDETENGIDERLRH